MRRPACQERRPIREMIEVCDGPSGDAERTVPILSLVTRLRHRSFEAAEAGEQARREVESVG